MPGDRDFRSLSAAVQAERRRRAVSMVDGGMPRQAAAKAVGVNRRFVTKWLRLRDQAGEVALEGGRRGRRAGDQLALAAADQARIKRLIADKCPDQLKLPFALWTRAAVADLIEREAGVGLSLQAVGLYLARWGMTAQRPAKRAIERDEARIRAWLNDDYPAIAARAKREAAEIHWADETGLSNHANDGRSFAPKGQIPVVSRRAKKMSQSMISSLTNRGTLRFMIYDGALNAPLFLIVLRRLLRRAERKIFLIVDNLRVHHAKIVKTWVEANKDRIELFFLPPYAPEHNPDEFVNNDVKQSLARQPAAKTADELKRNLSSYRRRLQRQTDKIRRFCQAPLVQYAA